MFLARERLWLPAFLLMILLLIVASGCGTNSSTPSTGGGNAAEDGPDRVKIEINTVGLKPGKSIVTLDDASLAEQLYATVFDLQPMPGNQICTEEMGPSYVLTFLQGGKELTVVTAERYGCKPISIAGDALKRQSTDAFWKQLDQAISKATPSARPDRLSILHTVKLNQAPATAQINSEETARRLYNAILELSLVSLEKNCSGESLIAEPRYQYQLVFHTTDQTIASALDYKCNTISLGSELKTTGGTYEMNDQFKKLFEETVKAAKFAPAQPDQLSLSLTQGGTSSHSTITNASLRQQLYTKVFKLSPVKDMPSCSSDDDKVSGKGKWYSFTFTQWDLPVLELQAYEGSNCMYASLTNEGTGNQPLQTDEEFWNLVHRSTTA